jgi:hypothetical protein
MKKACFALALFLVLAPNARATTGTGSIPLAGTAFSSCLSEPVSFSGLGHFTFVSTQNADGTFSVLVNAISFSVQGIGVNTGGQYQVTLLFNNNLEFRAGPSFAFSFIETFAVNGSGGHVLLHITMHATVNNNGTVTVSFDNFTTQC